MTPLSLLLWSISIPLMPYALIRKKENLLYGAVLVFLLLSIDVLIGLNTPNPDHTIWLQVATFGE